MEPVFEWSPKQVSFIAHSTAFINLADGAIRSGKTHASLWSFAEMCVNGPAGEMAVVGKTTRTAKSNVILPLKRLLPKGAVRYVQGMGELYVFGRMCHVLGANDERAQDKITGMTLAGSYLNEVALYPEGVWEELKGRHSVDGAKILGDCNPESPYHYLHKNELIAGKSKTYLKRWRYKLTDNPSLYDEDGHPKQYILNILEGYPEGSLWRRRRIDGDWVAAEGAIYQQWNEDVHVVDEMSAKPEKVVIGIDYGTSNATVFLALGKVGRTWYVFDEYYHSGRDSNQQKTDAEYSRELRHFIDRVGYPSSIEIDPSAASFKVQLRKDGVTRLRDADNSVVDGIRTTSTALTTGSLKVLRRCEGLREEFPGYVWDPDKQDKGEDYPLKGEGMKDHALDGLRYACMRVFKRANDRENTLSLVASA